MLAHAGAPAPGPYLGPLGSRKPYEPWGSDSRLEVGAVWGLGEGLVPLPSLCATPIHLWLPPAWACLLCLLVYFPLSLLLPSSASPSCLQPWPEVQSSMEGESGSPWAGSLQGKPVGTLRETWPSSSCRSPRLLAAPPRPGHKGPEIYSCHRGCCQLIQITSAAPGTLAAACPGC